MRKRRLTVDKMDVLFLSITDTCTVTGLSQCYLRKGCQKGEIPHIMNGRMYMINVPALLEKLKNESIENMSD